MKYIKVFESVNDAVGQTMAAPFTCIIRGDKKKALVGSKKTYGDTVEIYSDGAGYIIAKPKSTTRSFSSAFSSAFGNKA